MVILGSTGSIGVNALNICREFNVKVEALVANSNIRLLNQQIEEFKPKFIAIGDESRRGEVSKGDGTLFWGENGILELLEATSSKKVLNAIVGFSGLRPTLKSLELGKSLALANKESLVVAGKFIDSSLITPVDSEHFGLWYLLGDRPFNKLYITASGGAFRSWEIEKIADAKLEDALKHPNWSMGRKITIDSASMVNKLFELLEARWLFNTIDIDAIIERSSKVHALVEFLDGTTTAQLSGADMRLPIAYAILDRVNKRVLEPLNLLELNSIKFEKIEIDRYPIWEIKSHLLNNPDMGVILNSANEAAIDGFIAGKYRFFKMVNIILDTYNRFIDIKINSLDDIFKIDKEVREYVRSIS